MAALMVFVIACGGGDNTGKSNTGNPPASSGGSASGTASPSKEPEQVTLKFMNWGSVEAATKPGYEAMVAAFEKKYPHIKIENVGVPFNQMLDQILVQHSAGSSPDVMILHGTWTSAMNAAGALQPLDELIPADVQSDFYPNLIGNLKYDDELVGLPWTPAPSTLYYNKELLKQAGITELPTSFKEVREMAKQIAALGKTDTGNTIYGFGLSSQRLFNSGFYFIPYIWEQGGDLTNEAGEVTLDTPEVVKAFEATKQLFTDKVTPVGADIKELRNLFAQGQLGFYVDIDAYGILLDLSPKKTAFANDFGMMRLPDDNAFYLEYVLGMSSQTKHQEEAALFLEFMSGAEAMTAYNNNGGNRTPARESSAAIDYYQKPENAHMQFYIEAIQNARPLPVRNPGFVKAMEEVAEAIQRVGINNEEPAKVVKELQAKVNAIYTQ